MADVEVRPDVVGQYDGYYAGGVSEWRRLGALDKAANIVALCRHVPVSSILEIGAGDGSILSRLSELGFGDELHAAEISRSGVSVIERRGIPRLVECRIFDGSHLPWDAGRFDLAVLSHVVEHLEHPRQLLTEAARVARYVLVEVPTEDISRRAKDYAPDRVGHINFFSPRTIRWLVQSSGLRVLTQVTTNPSKAVYVFQAGRKGLIQHHTKNLLLRLAPALATRHFCYHEVLLATAEPEGRTGAPQAVRSGSDAG
jgi:ubiquinone/menaquinone biosynthesis C-methylase UbiE